MTRSTPPRPATASAAASALVDSQVERLGHELTLVERQLSGYSRRTGAYMGHETLEIVEPAVGRYRDELVAERERILTRIGVLSAMRRAVLHPALAQRAPERPAVPRAA
ncbi:hypothetical protein [Cellulosimicrobium cellulans]|uniref:hypothetical protein n=1 Tax=Cellulosimicrobium cellulans TaxID=1710 RepID=UPI000848653B|nr:hypothetical protein [Cellulosimicrobium cellulans]